MNYFSCIKNFYHLHYQYIFNNVFMYNGIVYFEVNKNSKGTVSLLRSYSFVTEVPKQKFLKLRKISLIQ